MKPLNNHLMIEPLKTSKFMSSERTTFEEVGKVLAEPGKLFDVNGNAISLLGTVVYFDSWLAKKYPVIGEIEKFVWFVEYKDLVAYEPLPE